MERGSPAGEPARGGRTSLEGFAAGRRTGKGSKEVRALAVWVCSCGYEKDSRCKPQKCPQCGEKGTFNKKA